MSSRENWWSYRGNHLFAPAAFRLPREKLPPGCEQRFCPETGRRVRAWERARKEIFPCGENATRSSRMHDGDNPSRHRQEDRRSLFPFPSSAVPATRPEKSAVREGSTCSKAWELYPPGARAYSRGGV